MLARGARRVEVDMLEKWSCGEGGISTAAAIHKNMQAPSRKNHDCTGKERMKGGSFEQRDASGSDADLLLLHDWEVVNGVPIDT